MKNTIPIPKPVITTTREEWIKELNRRFGNDPKQWKFKCVHCGEVQCLQDFIDAGVKNPQDYVYYSCIGRYVKGRGCDWTLGGLFQIHKIQVDFNGQMIPVFEMAE